jgi:hypothetical protein
VGLGISGTLCIDIIILFSALQKPGKRFSFYLDRLRKRVELIGRGPPMDRKIVNKISISGAFFFA